MQKLSNKYLSVSVNEKGGCISAIRDGNGNAFTFGGADYWNYCDHILFPFCGRMNGGYYEYGNKRYSADLHGFAKDIDFSVLYADENTLTLGFSSNENTLAVYPFEFDFRVTYRLNENALGIEYEVLNKDKKTMYFALGSHPGFITDDESVIDLGASDSEYIPLEGNFLSREIKIEKQSVIKPDKALFKKHGTFVARRKSGTLTLKRKVCDITVSSDSPLIALWADEERDSYVCIESWWGACDYATEPIREISQKPYINALEAGKAKRFACSITVSARQEII